ncbi:MAG: PAS domain S-box protein, partial [Planctomycetes bacterium]|nr:PAS domain S-box protein [Planctomycetota bacterium]
MTIARKLFLGFLGLIFLIAFLAAFGVYHVRELQRDTDRAEQYRRNALTLREIQLRLRDTRDAFASFLKTGDEAHSLAFEHLTVSVSKELARLVYGCTEEEERRLSAIRAGHVHLTRDLRVLMESRKGAAHTTATVPRAVDEQMDGIYRNVEETIVLFGDRVNDQVRMAEADARAAFTFMAIDGVLAVIAGCAIAVAIAGQITGPVHRLAEMTRHIAQGDLTQRVDVRSADELGVLASSFNAMATELAKSRAEIEEYSRSLERKVADRTAELQQSEHKYRSLMENAGDAIFLVSPSDGRMLEMNRKAEVLTGYTRSELLRMSIRDLFPREASVRVLLGQAAAGLNNVDSHVVARKDQRRLTVEISTSPIEFSGQKVCCSIVHDVTERRELERQVMQADRLTSLGHLAGGVAHELNNPLNSILMNANLVLEVTPKTSESHEDVRRIAEDAMRCKRIIDELLDFARQSRVEGQHVVLNDVVTKTLGLMQHEVTTQRTRVETCLAEGLPPVRGDLGQMQQVLVNLMLNAIQAMGPGGSLAIETRHSVEPGFVDVSVRDSGPGIPVAIRERVFDPFFTTKEKGTGLGLSVCYRIVERHGGRIKVESRTPEEAT